MQAEVNVLTDFSNTEQKTEKCRLISFYYIYALNAQKICRCVSANRWHYWVFTQITQITHFSERGNKFTATVKLNRELQIDP